MVAARFDVRRLAPSDLAGLTDTEFRQVVDADLRRRVNPEGLSERVSRALRHPDNLNRWHATLTGIARSVEGQLTAASDEFEAVEATTLARIEQIRAGRPESPQISQLQVELAAQRSDYLKKKAGRERFKTGVDEHIVVAAQLLSGQRDEMYDSVVAAERDRHARKIRRLERAIRDHQTAVQADLGEDEEPTEYEEALWQALDG